MRLRGRREAKERTHGVPACEGVQLKCGGGRRATQKIKKPTKKMSIKAGTGEDEEKIIQERQKRGD